MPEDSRKSLDKKKNDPKEQRRPRNARSQASKVEKKEKIEETRSAPKVTVPQKPPVYQDPGPEFYKNLKRETEEILKITEEENSKYKKKEIQSNWSKYEMPIESYDETEEQDVGADYEKLIQVPLSIGGHFQFKHEKSWDVNTGPSLYDKYFEINMDNLSLAVSTVPFYERNGVDPSLFSETDMLSMNNRATKYKQKYFEDKSYSTAETEAQDRILNSLKESLIKNEVETDKVESNSIEVKETVTEDRSEKDDIDLDFKNLAKTDDVPVHSYKEVKEVEIHKPTIKSPIKTVEPSAKIDDDIDDLLLEDKPKIIQPQIQPKNIIDPPENVTETQSIKKTNDTIRTTETEPKVDTTASKNPVIESPEDLEKWLDDFLDG